MDRRLMSLVVAMVLFSVGPKATVDGAATPEELDKKLEPHLDSTTPFPEGPGVLADSVCLAHGDVRYDTFDHKTFAYNSPVGQYGVMFLPWRGNRTWVMTEHELRKPGDVATRIKEVYVKFPIDLYFRATLGSDVDLFVWFGGAWLPIGIPDLPKMYFSADGDVRVSYYGIEKTYEIQSTMFPYLYVAVHRHSVKIYADGWWAAGGLDAIRGICGDFNGNPDNDCVNLEAPAPFQNWTPFLI
ncbi:uncharacterized protein LOC106157860 [Lingula anatina]|uniref:Uncharacterized protein LOC106157860 n=1 Tax=Lingula anatina TaxID=7574 RepID=A0A1S3HSU9_LINAN|nr:uncharacterized protein LOC106157860 [Lingula anatina]|eukprot:XP_013389098.1 uncharacterized protein LOC106157860 [Lingula anatina]